MEAVLLVGLQAAGKTSFYQQRFAATHVHISLDRLKTRGREMAMVRSCLERRENFVIDNTNPTVEARGKYINVAKAAGYRVLGYYFDPDIAGCLRRNAARPESQRIPVPGLFGTRKRLKPPSLEEGFDALFQVELMGSGEFTVHPWSGDDAELRKEPRG